jgi:regulator of protease activity HflC (stomatin/prohibitin superfamily)
MGSLIWALIGVIVLILLIMALSGIRVVQQYERGVIFVLGKLWGGLAHDQG